MSGIFSVVSSSLDRREVKELASKTERRGSNVSGVITHNPQKGYGGLISDISLSKLLAKSFSQKQDYLIAYAGMPEGYGNGAEPIRYKNMYAVTDSLILNKEKLINDLLKEYKATDSMLVAILFQHLLSDGKGYEEAALELMEKVEGTLSAIILLPEEGKLVAFSKNNGLYWVEDNGSNYLASEATYLTALGYTQVISLDQPLVLNIPRTENIGNIEQLKINKGGEGRPNLALLQYQDELNIRRCTKCILPETMPFIRFDNEGVCNYCHNYTISNAPRPKEELFEIVAPYRREEGYDCIVPFSGGRDSCFALHLIVKELGMKPVTYTYDWGMVTEVGQRNISRMCGELGIENIVVAADVEKKRRNLALNLKAWLKNPDLGMLNILTAGDKHFFKYVEEVKQEAGIELNLWGVNPLEVTHFKTGFLGIEPNFELKGVYSKGALKQLRYQAKRFRAMLKSPGYFNSSIWDTLSGEYYRSFTKKSHYYHIFDYWRWDEAQVEEVLDHYGWEKAIDTDSSWRIGDGVSGFYNYVYYTVAGFTENDTFRSNQIREGQLTREEALRLVKEENQPRYDNLQWFLRVLGFDFNEVIERINSIPKLY